MRAGHSSHPCTGTECIHSVWTCQTKPLGQSLINVLLGTSVLILAICCDELRRELTCRSRASGWRHSAGRPSNSSGTSAVTSTPEWVGPQRFPQRDRTLKRVHGQKPFHGSMSCAALTWKPSVASRCVARAYSGSSSVAFPRLNFFPICIAPL